MVEEADTFWEQHVFFITLWVGLHEIRDFLGLWIGNGSVLLILELPQEKEISGLGS